MNVTDKEANFQVTQVELVYRSNIKPSERHHVDKSTIAYDLFLSAWDMNKIELVEAFKIMLLDCRMRCLGISDISTGGITDCIVDTRIIFATALTARASNLILAHNHPSGLVEPSDGDIKSTKKLRQAGELLGITVCDHLIVAPDKYFSFAANEIMP